MSTQKTAGGPHTIVAPALFLYFKIRWVQYKQEFKFWGSSEHSPQCRGGRAYACFSSLLFLPAFLPSQQPDPKVRCGQLARMLRRVPGWLGCTVERNFLRIFLQRTNRWNWPVGVVIPAPPFLNSVCECCQLASSSSTRIVHSNFIGKCSVLFGNESVRDYAFKVVSSLNCWKLIISKNRLYLNFSDVWNFYIILFVQTHLRIRTMQLR